MTFRAMEYWLGHKDQYPSLSAVALTSSQLLHLGHTLNTFSASVVTSLLTRETVLRHHWSAGCFEVKLEVSV